MYSTKKSIAPHVVTINDFGPYNEKWTYLKSKEWSLLYQLGERKFFTDFDITELSKIIEKYENKYEFKVYSEQWNQNPQISHYQRMIDGQSVSSEDTERNEEFTEEEDYPNGFEENQKSKEIKEPKLEIEEQCPSPSEESSEEGLSLTRETKSLGQSLSKKI
jgi:hypothetical protein